MHHDFLDKYSDLQSPVHSLDSRVKIVFFSLLIIICVSTPADKFRAFFAYLAILSVVLILSRIPLAHILRKSLVIIPFVLLVSIFLPFLKTDTIGGGFSLGIGNIQLNYNRLLILWNVMIKSFTAVITLIILTATTGFPNLMKGARGLKAPLILINMLNFFYRYIFVIIDESQRMKRALEARMFRGKKLKQAKVIGDFLGILFLRSYERGERVYLAMCARGGADGSTFSTPFPKISEMEKAILMTAIVLLFIIRFVA
jgi:cobalt/nickel transport system permease protein